MKAKPMTFVERIKMIRRALRVFVEDDAIAELRIPKADDGPQSGLFDDLDEMTEAAENASGKVPGVYFVMNRVKESLRRRVTNQLTKASSAVKDADIDRRRWFLVDFDPVRRSKSPATDAEHDDAIATAKECRDGVGKLGWPEPGMADSGNGAHLLYRVDLPNDQKSDGLVRNCLLALALRFSTATVTVDTGNWNASHASLWNDEPQGRENGRPALSTSTTAGNSGED